MDLKTRNWLLNLPCVLRRDIIVDVRGASPVMIRGLIAETVTTKEDVINFVVMYLPASA